MALSKHTQDQTRLELALGSYLFLAVLLPISFFALYFCSQPSAILRACDEYGDFATIGLRALLADRLELLVGPYSRFGFSHPGPVLYYLYSAVNPLLFWIPSSAGKLIASQILINIFCVAASLWMLGSASKSRGLQVVTFLCILFCLASAREGILVSVWNPAVVILPVLLCIIASAYLATGVIGALPLVCLSATLAVQNHLSTIPLIAILCLSATGLFFRHRKLDSDSSAKAWIVPVSLSVVCLVVSFLPPLYEAWTQPGWGNLGKIFRFSRGNTEAVTLGQSVTLIAGFYKAPLLGLDILPQLLLMPLVILLPYLISAKLPEYAASLRLMALLSAVAMILSTFVLKGDLHRYIFWYAYAPVISSYLVLIIALSQRFSLLKPSRLHLQVAYYIIAFSAGLALSLTYYQLDAPRCAGRVATRIQELQLNTTTLYRIRLEKQAAWKSAAALILMMERNGFSACIDREWEFMFTSDFSCKTRRESTPWKDYEFKLVSWPRGIAMP